MITIEMKIDLFSKMVREKALSEPKRILDALNVEHAKILDEMEHSCEVSRQKYLAGVYQKHSDKQKRAIAKAQSDAQSRIVKKRHDMLAQLKDSLKAEVASTTESPEYKDRFAIRVQEALEKIGAGQTVVVARAADLALLAHDVVTRVDDGIMGGFYVIKNDAEKYDFTLDSELDSMDAFLGCMMNTLYEITGEDCHD